MEKTLFIRTPANGYWLSEQSVKKVEERYTATFMGPWCLKTVDGTWSEEPSDIFYVENPDTSKGHTHYFGIFYRGPALYITNGESAFEAPIVGAATEDGEVIVSRYRHDCVIKDGIMIDGGRDYVRRSGGGKDVLVTVDGSNFMFGYENE